jgi:mono/diheme cytochrome c family protein
MKARALLLVVGVIAGAALASPAVDNSWMQKVPEADRSRTNPVSGQADAVSAGARLFADHCAQCHGADALGRGKKPSLRSPEVQQATDGQIFWLLKNGYLRRGMPSWSSLPEPSRWQIIAYLKSLGEKTSAGLTNPRRGNER